MAAEACNHHKQQAVKMTATWTPCLGTDHLMMAHQQSSTSSLCAMGANNQTAIAACRPLVLGSRQGPGGQEWCVASEDCAFGPIGFHRERDVRPGEMLVITEQGDTRHHSHMSACMLEALPGLRFRHSLNEQHNKRRHPCRVLIPTLRPGSNSACNMSCCFNSCYGSRVQTSWCSSSARLG